jgi:1-deoxy-D-xylulose-5-phosphate synthase
MLNDASEHRLVVTVEDGLREGGVGTLIAASLSDQCLDAGRVSPPLLVMGVPLQYTPHGKAQQILKELELDAEGIAAKAAKAYGSLLTRRAI